MPSSASMAHNSPRGVKRNAPIMMGSGNDFPREPEPLTLRTHDDEINCSVASNNNINNNILQSAIADGTLNSAAATRGKAKRKEKKAKRPYNVRNKNRPKRPLSAYNLFFRYERQRLVRETLTENGQGNTTELEGNMKSRNKTKTGKRVHRKTHGAIGFAQLGKHISEAWKSLDEKDRAPFQAEADKEKERYQQLLAKMEQNAPSDDRDASDSPKETWHSCLTDIAEKNKISDHPSEYQERGYNEGIGMDETSTAGLHYRPRYNHYPAASMGQHYPPSTHYDYYGHHGNDRHSAPSVPPHHNGPVSPPGYAPPQAPPQYPPYYGYQMPSMREGGESNDSHPQQHTAHAFSPPHPTHEFARHGNTHYPPTHDQGMHPRPGVNWTMESEQEENQRDFAFQCEVCNDAVFSTFAECAAHEEECAKTFDAARSRGPPPMPPSCVKASEDGDPSSHNRHNTAPSSNRAKADVEAVEAVMMLKKTIEC